MSYGHSTPFCREVFRYDSSVAVFGLGLTTQQHGRHVKAPLVYEFFHFARFQQGGKTLLIFIPRNLFVPIASDDFLGGSKEWFVEILNPADLLEEVGQIVALGKGSQLGRVIQSHIN
jgi:hypothetical protein